MDILVTDVTEMSEGMYCVAGWCAAARRMIRPLPEGNNWRSSLVNGYKVVPGVTVRVVAADGPAIGLPPHAKEDQRVSVAGIKVVDRDLRSWFGAEAPPSARTLADAFEGHLAHNREWRRRTHGAHVKVGAETRSLWAIEVRRDRVQFSESSYGKLKATLHDGAKRYELPVSSRALKEAWKNGGVAGVNGLIPSCGTLHVRVGLARAFADHPDKCYVMVNGIYG